MDFEIRGVGRGSLQVTGHGALRKAETGLWPVALPRCLPGRFSRAHPAVFSAGWAWNSPTWNLPVLSVLQVPELLLLMVSSQASLFTSDPLHNEPAEH
jgi:hypothetical protein